MTVIDLGERRDVDGAADPGPGRFLRRWSPALVALLCLATSAAAAPWPAQPPGTTVPAGPDASALFVDGVLLVAEPSGPGAVPDGDPVSRLAAHRLPSGRPLWRVPLPAPGRVFHAVLVGDLLSADGTTLHRRQRDGRYLVGRIDERGEGVRVLAALRGVVGECGTHGSYVACRREGGGFGVWELPGDRDRKGRA